MVVPGVKPVIKPLVDPIIATMGDDDNHVPLPVPVSIVLPATHKLVNPEIESAIGLTKTVVVTKQPVGNM